MLRSIALQTFAFAVLIEDGFAHAAGEFSVGDFENVCFIRIEANRFATSDKLFKTLPIVFRSFVAALKHQDNFAARMRSTSFVSPLASFVNKNISKPGNTNRIVLLLTHFP